LPGFAFFSRGCEGFGFAEKDFTEAGWASLFLDFFRVGALLGRADEAAVFVFVDLADPSASLRAGSFSCLFCDFDGMAMAVVLRCDLESVNEDPGAGVDTVGGEGEDDVRDGELDGVGVLERREVVDYDRGLALRHPGAALAVGLVEVAEALVLQCG
jgi:hypothetical protein